MGTLTVYYNSTSTSRYTETRSSFPTVQYNGQTYSPFNASNTAKEMACSGKRMRSNLVIGGKTIGCNGKIMRSNVKAVYNPALIGPTQPTALSVARRQLAATYVGNYALFGGGYASTGASAVVDAYDASLTHSVPTALSATKNKLVALHVGNYALFTGGDTNVKVTNAYNASLTRSIPTAANRAYYVGASVGNYAVFTGSSDYGGGAGWTDVYDSSLTLSTLSSGASGRSGATSIGNYALFAGGWQDTPYTQRNFLSEVRALNTSLTYSTITALSVGKWYVCATSVGNYALFGGGLVYTTVTEEEGDVDSAHVSSNTVEAYNTSLTRSSATSLSAARYQLAATSVSNYALFGSGYYELYNYARRWYETQYYNNKVDAYNASLTRSTPTAFSAVRKMYAATSIASHALFGGGTNSNGNSAVVDAYSYS